MNNILSSLQSMPIFRLSLGSKELFHSNFLEFLWDTDRAMFIRIINRLLPSTRALPTDIDYSEHELSREKENFDICLYHKELHKWGREDREHIVYDLIIENKVKSIPLKQQLDKYKIKVSKNKWNNSWPPRYLLLSLVDNFADKQDIQYEDIWAISNYDQLKAAIEAEKNCWSNAVGASYITDYCTFIGFMNQLQIEILQNFNMTQLFQDVDDYKHCRLHDLYIKLRCCKFLMQLKNRLVVEHGLKPDYISFIKEHKNIRDNMVPHVYLNYNIFSGVGQAATWIYSDNTKEGDIHEVVIQGNQYRHGINKMTNIKPKTETEKIQSQQHIWDMLHKDPFDATFLDTPAMPNPNKPKKNRTDSFNGYGPEYVYRYDIITNETVEKLLDRMAKDVMDVVKR